MWLEKHLSRFKFETIPNDAVKRMLLDCITGKAQSEIVLLKPDGLAFDNYEIGEFFQELLKKFTHEKDEEGRKMEYLQRRQARNEDARQYYTDKLRLFVQEYPPAGRSLVEFKTSMLLGLYNAEMRKTCLTFMPKEIKHEREIKAVLDHQLVNLRTYNMDPRAPAQDMAGLHSTYGYDRSETSKANEMLKTRQVNMDVNAMPYRMEICVISARKLVIRREIAGSSKNGKRKNPTRNLGETLVVLLPAPQFCDLVL